MKKIFALGFFDGVHLGHQALLHACEDLSEKHNCLCGVVTFTSHPDGLVLGSTPVLLNTSEDRKVLLQAYGAKTVVELPFDKALMTTPWQDFLESLLEKGAAGFVCGEDFRFGAGGSGTAEKLESFCRERGLPCAIVPEQDLDGSRISSTRIRQLLESGDLENANKLLGHPHMLSGIVVTGKQLGRTIGVPTANIAYPGELQPLTNGVYACKAAVEGIEYPAVTNIGVRPTVNGQGVNAECHLLDFSGDLYGKTLTISFHKFLRPEKKFPTLADLQQEIRKNIDQTRNFFEKSE